MDNDKRKKVYDVLTSKTGYKDSFDDFNKFMDDGAARRKVYDVLREQTGYRDSFEDFDKFMSSSHQGEMPVPIVPMRPTEPDLSFSNPSAGKFVQNGLDANEELLNDVKAEPVKDGMGRSYFPVKPQKVMEDEIRREYQVEPIESQINNAIVANEEAIRRIEQGKTEDYDRKAEEHPFLHALGGFARQHEGRVPDVNPSNDKEALRNLYAERNKLEEAKKVIEASRTDGILSNIGAGVKDAVTDMGFYDFGMTEMSDNSRLLGIKAKLDNKQPLTEDEQKLLNAAALAQGVQSSHQDRISPWYTAGQTTANMAPFMAEMLVNPAAGLGKAAQKAVTKKVSGLVGKSLAKKMLPKLSRVAGDVAGASVMTGTTGIMRTVADAEGRMLGDVNSSIRDGEIVGNGFSGGLDAGEASAKAFGANTIENWSEMLGEYFSPALKGMGMVTNKGMRKMGLGRVSDFISDINSTSLARGIDDFLEKTQWNGPIGEIAEEEAGIIANSYITGDNKLSDLTDPRLQLDIVLGVGLFGGFVSGMKTIGYRSPSKIAEKDLKRAEKNASSMFDNWEDIRLEIENTDEEQLPDTLNSIIGHAAGNDNAKKAAIVDYAYSLQKWRGVNAAKLKQTVENPAEAQNLVENEEDGTGAEAIPEFDKVSVYRNFKRAERKVAQALPNTPIEKIEDVTDVDKFAADNGLNEEQKSAVTDYMAAKEPYSIYQSDVEARKEVVKSNAREQAVKDAERTSNPDTGFITQVKHKFSETPVYLVGGNLSFGDDGLLDRSNSTETVYYLDENGKRLPAPAEDFDSIVSQSSKEELVANAEAQATADFDAQENESLASPEILPPGIGETVSLDGGTYVIEGADNDNPGNFSALKLNTDGEIEVTPGLSEQISLSPDEYYEAKEAELWKNDGIQPEQPVGKVDEVVAPALVQGVDKMPEISSENASGPEMEDNKVSEETPEQRLQKVVDSLPKKKDGNIDYRALTPQQRFDYTSAAESPEVAIEDLKSDVAAKNEELEKINARLEKAIGGERVELRDTIRSKKKELDELTAFFQSVVPEQPSVPEDVRTDEDYVEWVADNSDDAEEVLGAYSVAKELASHEQTLKPWQRELLGRKVSTSSFVRFGDRNHITGTLAKGWLRKDGEEIDSIAQELTANGVDVSEQDIVDFILDNPSNRVSEISDTMRSLSSRFSEIATKETGIPVGGPESNTGKLYIQLKEANKKIDELTDEQKADMRNALIADMDASDVQRSGDYYESLADYAEQYDRFRDEMNAEEADEAVIRQMEAESPTLYHGGFTADELDDIYSQIENDNGTERQTEDSGETQPALSGDEIEQREEPGIPDAVGAEDSESEGQDSGVVPDIEEIQDNTLDNEDESLSLHLNSKEEENGTISESVPQGEHREEAPQNPRMEEASIGLRDRVEASTRNAQASGGTLSERKKQEIEQRSAESYAKETGQWIPMSDIFAWQPMPSGNENDVYLNTDDGQVYKVNNLMNSKGILPLFDRLRLHNQLFPESRYEFVGFTGFDNGSVFPIFKQEYVNDAEPASPEEIDSYMRSLGFKQTGEAAYSNGDVVISDLRPRNVLKDTDGDLYVVDADFKKEDAVSFEASPISPGENVLDYAERISREKEMHDVRQSVDTNPTDAQKEAGNYKKGHIKLDGYDITIENPKGSERSGTDAKGGKWSVTMNNDYGYIRGTQGVDGDHIDVFLSDDPTTGNVYVIDQVKEDGSFDEHKVMYGFGSALAAKRAYLSNYSKGWNGLGKITQVSKDEFRKWVNSSRRKTKPFAEYKSVKMESDIRTDRQGNPVDADRKLIIEDVNSINDITDADFTNPTRSIGLPAIPRNVSDAIGADGKRVIIKKNIFEKNGKTHAFAPQASRDILERALYNPDIVGQSQPNTKKNHWIAIKLDDKSPIVVLEVNNNKDNVEIVGWYTLDNRNLDRIRRQAEREGGELLILTSKEAAASLSTLPLDLPSADKDSEQSDNKQEMQENTSSALDAAMEKLGDIEQKWEDRILDYIAEHYPTQATVSAQTNSPEGMRERMAMKNDETLKRMREQAQTEFNAADEKVMSLYRRYKTSLGEDDIRFRDIDTEDKEELVAVHNISEEKLKEALDLGGFPMPSIAITKADVGHTTFGDISLVFDKESINPTDRRNKVYGEDAWTPTFPNVGYKLNGDKTSDIYRRANKVGRLPLFNPTSFHPDSYERYINGLGAESLVNHFKNDYNAKQLYLSETGNAVEEYERHEVDKYLPDKVALYEKVLTEIGIEKLKNERNDALENDVKRFIEEHYNIDLDAVKPHIAKTRINNTIRYAIDYAENGNKVTENDFEATKKKIDERIDPKKFEEWLEELFTDVVEKKGIRNDKDLFTPSGNSRKWEQLYDEITLDNVVNAMQKQAAKGGQGLFGASIFGAAQEEYKSIDEIRKAARERIRTMDEADYKAQRDVITDRLSDIKIPGVGNGFSDTMDMVQNIQDAVARSHTAKGIYKYLKEFYPKVTMEAANEIADIVKDIQRMSARYFEAKPYRAVGFDEVRLAVVPSDTDANLVEQLKHLGIEVRTYDHGNEGQRGQIVKEATDEMNLRFRENDEVNRKFNEELQLQIDGTLPEGHVYQLGNPSRELLSAGIPDLPIELSAERLEKKASKEYESNHPFNLESIKNLPQALNYPIAVFEARKKNGAKVVLTELNENGNNFIAAIKVRKSDDSRTVEVEVNDIRSLYPKDRKSGILEWINSGLLKWVDKNKASDFFSTQWPNYIGGGENKSEASDRSLAYISASAPIADATYKEELSSATKIVENFNNPTPEQGEIISAVEELSSRLNTPVHIIRSLDELTDGAARRAIMAGRRGVKAWFTNGEVTLYLPHATSTDDARRSVLHEVVGHKGLRDLFGKEEFDGMMEKLYGQLPGDVRQKIHDTAKSKYNGVIPVAMDEYLAGQAELDETPSWWNRVVSAVRGFLREMGVDVLLSSNDVKYLLWKSKNRLMNTDNGLAVINKIAAGEAMKEKLHIGEYSRTPEQEKADYDRVVKVVGDFAGSHAGAANALVIRSRDLMRRQLEARDISAEDIEKYEQWFDEKGTCAFWSPKYQTIFVLNKSVSEKEINGYLWHENVHHAFDVLYGSEEKKSRIARLYEELSPYSASDFAHIEGLYVDESVETQKEECVTALFEELTKRYEGKTEDVISKMQGKGIISDSTLKELYNYIHYGTKEGYGSRRIRPGFDGFLEKPVEEKTMEVRNSDGDFRRSAESEGSGHPVRGMVEEGAGSISGTGESGTEERNKGNRPLGRALDTGYELDMRNSGDAGHHKEEKGAGSQGTEPRAKEGNQTGEGVTRFRDTTGDKPSDGTVEQYEEELKKQSFKAKEAYQDSMLALKKLQDVVVKRSGKALKSFEDAYTAENHLSSINTAEVESYGEHFFRPMIEAIGELVNNGNSYEDVKRYVFAKHGLERNEVFAERDARNAVTEKYWREKELVNRQYYDGKLMEDEYEEKMQGIQQAEKDFYEKQYEENRLRDYSGLTALTGEKEDYEDAAQAIVDEFERGNDVTELWRTINNATKETLNKTYESGLMDKATYERVRAQFKHYVPLRGWNEKTAADVYEYLQSEVSPVNATMRTAKGRMSLADDPFATIGNMAESNIFMSNRNLMKQRFMNMVLNHPSDVVSLSEAWYVKDASTGDWVLSAPDILENDSSDEIRRKIEEHEERMRLLSKDGDATKVKEGLNIDYRISARQAKEHMVVVKRNGKEYVMYINGNPRVAQAINGMTNPNVNEHPVWKWIGNLNRQLAANFTTRNPAFVATNLSRDLIYAISSTYVKEGTEYGNRYLKNIPKAMKVVMRNLRGKGGNSIEDIYFREFLANGGETGYADLKDVKAYKKFVEHELGKITGKKDYFKYLKACASFFSLLNRWAENVSRFDAYMTSREMGKNVFDSVSEAKEVTVNFNKKGAGYKTKGFFGLTSGTFRELFLFFNAAVQSLTNFSKMAYNYKKGFVKMVGDFAVAGYLVPMLNGLALSLFGDDGDDDYYNNLSEWVRRNNICIYRGNGKFITIPLPIELRAFYGLGEMAYQVSAGNTHGAWKIGYDAINQITELLPINPLGNNGDILSSFTPDIAKPIVQLSRNKDYTGKPIYKENSFNENMPEWTKTYNGTTKWLKNLSEWTNELTGGNKYKRGWVDVNPAKVEHLFESYFGGMAKTINQASNTLVAGVESAVNGEMSEDLVWRNVPILNRFVSDGSDDRTSFSKVNSRYYELYDVYKDVKQQFSGYKKEILSGNLGYLEDLSELQNSREFDIYAVFEKYRKSMDKLNKLEKSFPESSKSERKEVEKSIMNIKKEIVRAVDGE